MEITLPKTAVTAVIKRQLEEAGGGVRESGDIVVVALPVTWEIKPGNLVHAHLFDDEGNRVGALVINYWDTNHRDLQYSRIVIGNDPTTPVPTGIRPVIPAVTVT